ncbi:alpha,alpha-trehalase TreF [Pedobacter rhodius]|uniref:Alpha,alpha-trehalase TreF n=1 Tax=Pedobacter rhodius TaxID=3004098 RepID=A0ABT4KU01_9SPHI|nr:alpha,alpha-trehalase TreF [Pedobacter sp. SJ11]MCZ4222401.1 alpha,alpha-trehalase TreF [Pedobacter sp. SJ11]
MMSNIYLFSNQKKTGRFKFLQLFIFCLLLNSIQLYAQKELSPRQTYPGLFERVQLARVYPDGKSFADAIPQKKPSEIMKAFEAQKNLKEFNLKRFVNEYFKLPENHNAIYQSDINAGIEKHLDTLWTVLKRNPDTLSAFQTSLLPLPKPYLVPGGRFREIYYWDSYFTMLGLLKAGKTQTVKDMVDNFAYLINTYGFIPNGNRSYYLTRSQPPFFAAMVQLLTKYDADVKLSDYKDVLEKEYNFWMKGAVQLKKGTALNHVVKLTDGTVLNRYHDAGDQPREESYREDYEAAKLTKQEPSVFLRNVRSAAESGWDFSSRWFADGKSYSQIITTDLLPVDLNSLMYNLEIAIADANKQAGNETKAKRFTVKASQRKAAILKYFWNSKQLFFTDYNWKKQRLSNQLTLAASFPLYFKLASPAQAKSVAEKIEKDFLKSGGLITTVTTTKQQWDAPNAWAPLQYVSIQGLHNYGYDKLADTITNRWVNLNIAVFKETGKLMEKYNVVEPNSKGGGGGEYPLQDGFGWTNGVLLKLMKK